LLKELFYGIREGKTMTSNPTVIHVKDVITRKFRVRRPSEYQKGLHIFGIIDADTNDVLVVQMNQLRLLWIDSRSVRFHDEEGLNFKQMEAVCNRICKVVKQKHEKLFKGLTYIDPFRNEIMSFSNLNWEDVACINRMNQPLDWRRVRKTEMVDVFMYPKNMWTNATNYGFSFRFLQLRRCEPLGCNLFSTIQRTLPPPPPPPPPKQRPLSIKNDLKSDHKSSKNNQPSNNFNSSSSLQVLPPSLEEILKSRQKLRITNLLSE